MMVRSATTGGWWEVMVMKERVMVMMGRVGGRGVGDDGVGGAWWSQQRVGGDGVLCCVVLCTVPQSEVLLSRDGVDSIALAGTSSSFNQTEFSAHRTVNSMALLCWEPFRRRCVEEVAARWSGGRAGDWKGMRTFQCRRGTVK